MDINANINIDDTQLNELVSIVRDSIDLTDDIESYLNDNVEDHVKTSIDDCIDNVIDDKIECYLDDNLESRVERELANMDFSDYFDAESEARRLLSNYNPNSSCSTGMAFRDAISETIAYLNVNSDTFKNSILDIVRDSIKDLVKESISEMVREELQKGITNTIKAEIFSNLRNAFVVSEYPRY